MEKQRYELRCDNRSMKIGIQVSNEIPYMDGYMVMLKNFKNEIVMYLPKGIFEVQHCNKRSLPYTSLVVDVSHLRRMFKSARNLWSKVLLNFTFDIIIVYKKLI